MTIPTATLILMIVGREIQYDFGRHKTRFHTIHATENSWTDWRLQDNEASPLLYCIHIFSASYSRRTSPIEHLPITVDHRRGNRRSNK